VVIDRGENLAPIFSGLFELIYIKGINLQQGLVAKSVPVF
jgi:hypothetical protein